MADPSRCRNPRRSATSMLFVLLLALSVLNVAAPVSAGPGEETDPDEAGYGDHPGNPQVLEDGAACFEDVADDPATTCVVLYGHIFDLFSHVPLNVQRPPVGTPDLAVGMSGKPTYETLGQDFNDYTMSSSPGFVEYYDDRTLEPFIHQEKGLTYAVETSPEVPMRGYFWLSMDSDEFTPAGIDDVDGTDPHLGIAPCLELRMTVATTHAFGAGETIAEGTTTKTVVSNGLDGKSRNATELSHACGVDGEEAEVMEPGRATEFAVDLGIAARDLPRDGGFHVEVEWHQYAPGDPKDQDKYASAGINLHTGHEYPNRVVVPFTNPLRIEQVEVTSFDGQVFFRPQLNTPWGSYDVDPTNLSIIVHDSRTGDLVADNQAGLGTFETLRMIDYDVTHAGHYDPVVGLMPWDAQADGIGAGTYQATITAWNWQHTATASTTLLLELDDAGRLIGAQTSGEDGAGGEPMVVHRDPPQPAPAEKDVPAPGLGGLLLVAGALVAVVRRRR